MQSKHNLNGGFMENKSTANKWLIMTVIVMSIIIVVMATWIIAGAVYKDKDSNSSVKTNQTKKDSSDSLEKTRGEGEELSNETKKEYKDFRTKGDGTGIRLTSASDVDKLDIDSPLKKFLKSKVGQPIPGREGSVYEPIIDRAYGKYAAVYGLTNAYTIIGPKSGTGEIAIVASIQQVGMPCSDLKSVLVPSRLVDGKCEVSGSSQTYNQD
jgi:hypothetical protein